MREALRIEPNTPEAPFYLGYLHDARSQFAEAARELEISLRMSNRRSDIVEGVRRIKERKYWAY